MNEEQTASDPGRHRPSSTIHHPTFTPNQRAWRRFRRNRLALISSWMLAIVLLIVLGWPIALKVATFAGPAGIAFSKNYQPEKLSEAQFQPPSIKHWFGTDVE